MFTCAEAVRYVDAWVDGELDPGASLLLETHVNECANCRAEVDTIRAVKRSMAALRESHKAPSSLRTKMLNLLDAQDKAAREKIALESQRARRRRHAAGFVLAGATLAGVVAVAVRPRDATSVVPAATNAQQLSFASMGTDVMPSAPAVVENLTSIHARALPAEVQGSQPQQIEKFFDGRMDVPVRPVAFRGVPAQFVGARFSNVQDRMAATLYYDVDGRRVSVFVFDGSLVPRDSNGLEKRTLHNGQPIYVGNAHGYTVTFSVQGGVGYALTSDMPQQDAIRIFQQAVFEQSDIQ